MSRIWFIIEDDWELRGNGLGHVAQHQYLPLLYMLDLLQDHGIKGSFMVEPLQQLAFERYAKSTSDIAMQSEIWRHCVKLIQERGHDVQLHLHPQWWKASCEDRWFRHPGSWNIADYPTAERQAMISAGLDLLTSVLGSEHRFVAFKAGAWAMQPSGPVLTDLQHAGIGLIMGPGRSIRYRTKGFVADYSEIEEDTLPYCPRLESVEKLGPFNPDCIVLPMPFYRRDIIRVLKQRLTRKSGHLLNLDRGRNPQWVEMQAPQLVPIGSGVLATIKRLTAPTTFDIGGTPLDEMCHGLTQAVDRALKRSLEGPLPIVLQSHTKGYDGNWETLRRFFEFLRKTWPKAEFLTCTEVWSRRGELAPCHE